MIAVSVAEDIGEVDQGRFGARAGNVSFTVGNGFLLACGSTRVDGAGDTVFVGHDCRSSKM